MTKPEVRQRPRRPANRAWLDLYQNPEHLEDCECIWCDAHRRTIWNHQQHLLREAQKGSDER